MNSRIEASVMPWPRVSALSCSYGFGSPWRRITVCTASASTSQLASRSAASRSGLTLSLPSPRCRASKPISMWPNAVPSARSTVESVRSRCQRLIGSLAAKCSNSALAIPKLPSAFSKSIGLTLCGIVLLPTSPAFSACLK